MMKNKLIKIISVFMGLSLMSVHLLAETDPVNLRLKMNSGWKLQVGDIYSAKPSNGLELKNWEWKMSDSAVPKASDIFEDDGAQWLSRSLPSGDVFGGKSGFAWFKAAIKEMPDATEDNILALHFGGVDDNATVYFNGKKIMRHEGHAEPFDVPITKDLMAKDGKNTIVVLVENTGGGGGIGKSVYLYSAEKDSFIPHPAKPAFDDTEWRSVRLPHDYVIEGEFSREGSHAGLKKPNAWYRRHFEAPAEWKGKSLWIDFDGVFRDSKVWINGNYLGNHKSGYTSFRYDIADYVKFGQKNVIAVSVSPAAHEGWWYEGGGIYRHVWMNVADRLHIEPCGVFVKTDVKNVKSPAPSAALGALASVKNDSNEIQKFSVNIDVLDPRGKSVAKSFSEKITLKPNEKTDVVLNGKIAKAELWSIEAPNLYSLKASIVRDGRLVDSRTVSFGVRTIRFDANEGFFLNEKHVKIKGACNHMDFPGVGVALPDNLHEWRIRRLQEVGCNAWRTSHNPVNPEMLDACDRLGMLVLNETRHFGDVTGMKTSLHARYDDLDEIRALVLRDRNHPSVIAWSIANEENTVEKTGLGERIGEAMKKIVYELDGTRPVTAGIVEHFSGYPGLSNVVDIEGLNYGPPGNYDKFHKLHPETPMWGTEITSALATRGEYVSEPFSIKKSDLVHLPLVFWGNKEKGYMNGLGLSPDRGHATGASWKAVAERPFVAGGFVWTGFDYKGEPHPFSWPVINSHFGFMDTCGFPKDDYYYYKAWWKTEPTLQIVPHWTWPKDKGIVKVLVHGNCEKVELFLNGRSLGAKEMPRYEHLSWDVEYKPGKLEAKGYNDGKLTATSRVETVGKLQRIELADDTLEMAADNESVCPVTVSLKDAKGRVVPYADNEVVFSVSGPGRIAGVGNGDPASHEPDKSDRRKAFHGLCMVIVQATGEAGEIVLHAKAAGLKDAKITLRSRPSNTAEMK